MAERIAANRIIASSSASQDEVNELHDAMIELSDGVITDIVLLSDLQSEPANTVFINGTLSATDGQPLFVGYRGEIVLNEKIISNKFLM